MQLLRSVYSNEVIRILITAGLLCLNCAAVGVILRLLHRKQSLLCWFVSTISYVIMGYIFSSAILFTVNRFGIRKALFLELILAGLFAVGILFRKIKHHDPLWGELDTDLRPFLIPIFLVIIGLVVSWGNFGYFGMGQDQGVYQVKAINLIYGASDRTFSFDEYDKFATDDEKETYYTNILTRQLGLDLIDATPEENRVLASLRTNNNDTHIHTAGIFHGIPTYPALLALWGSVFGIDCMSGIQTLMYILALLTLWLTAENLNLKKGVASLVCLLFMLSPEVVWSSKSTLTEILLALIIIRFMYDLTCPEPQHRWTSAWMVMMFALVHVSIFVMIWMFLLLYSLMYLWNGEQQYIRAIRISTIAFMGGYTFMTLTAPRYALYNTVMLWIGPINQSNIYWIFMAAAGIVFLFSLFMPKFRIKDHFASFVQGRGSAWLLRSVFVALLAISVLLSLLKSGVQGIEQIVLTNGMYNMIWMTGLLFLPVALIALISSPRIVLNNEVNLGLAVLFGYAVLLMCCVLKSDISYCYYFGRYLTPYIAIACIIIGLVWNRYSGKAVGVALAAGTILLAPFDSVMMWRQDDTFSSYDTFSRIIESVSISDSAVILEDHVPQFMIPVKTITRNDCYFADKDLDQQAAKLSAFYQNVFCITSAENNWIPVTKITDTICMDDNRSFRPLYCPFPLLFHRAAAHYNVYRYNGKQIFTPASLSAPDPQNREAIILYSGQIQSGPGISIQPGSYTVTYKGNNLSLAECYLLLDNKSRLNTETILLEDNMVILSFYADSPWENVEFVTHNPSMIPVSINEIILTPFSDD